MNEVASNIIFRVVNTQVIEIIKACLFSLPLSNMHLLMIMMTTGIEGGVTQARGTKFSFG